jgi:Adenine-specific methyltransferase EcoRI
VFTLEPADANDDGVINIEDLQWDYLKGDGDFRSAEVTALRDEADIVITNPPFSLFRAFLTWLVDGGERFSIIANMNAITYKEVFPLITGDRLWLGATSFNVGMYFGVPDDFVYAPTYKFERERDGVKVNRVSGVCWFTNLDHGRRHEPLQFMTMADNIKFSKHKDIRGAEYPRYDNFDAIEVPYVDAIPSDYDGLMGVPITFLDKYNPDQFEIVGNGQSTATEIGIKPIGQAFVDDYYAQGNKGQIHANWNNLVYRRGERVVIPFQRILIRHREANA